MTIGIVGAGVIGRGWAFVFARAGHTVRLFDAQPDTARAALDRLREDLTVFKESRFSDSIDAAFERLSPVDDIEEALGDATYVQESIREELSAKTEIFQRMDQIAAPEAILASSCSTIPPSDFLSDVDGRQRCIVAHPFNPPYLMPLVEIVPSKWTSEQTVEAVTALQDSVGQQPVLVRKEVVGYIGNRLQAAVVNEAMHLVGQGAIAPEDLDTTLRLGLGLRWALMGPFETMDLNADGGVEEYIEKFGRAYRAMGQTLGVHRPWTAQARQAVTRSRRNALPLEEIADRRRWRDRMLRRLSDSFAQRG